MPATRTEKAVILGLIAMVVGVLLVLGGLALLSVTTLMSGLPRILLVPPLVQIVLGLLAVVGGELLRRGYAAAGYLLAFVGIGVIANVAFLAVIAIAKMS